MAGVGQCFGGSARSRCCVLAVDVAQAAASQRSVAIASRTSAGVLDYSRTASTRTAQQDRQCISPGVMAQRGCPSRTARGCIHPRRVSPACTESAAGTLGESGLDGCRGCHGRRYGFRHGCRDARRVCRSVPCLHRCMSRRERQGVQLSDSLGAALGGAPGHTHVSAVVRRVRLCGYWPGAQSRRESEVVSIIETQVAAISRPSG